MSQILLSQAEHLKTMAQEKAASEMDTIGRTQWHGRFSARDSAVRLVNLLWEQTNQMIDNALLPLNRDAEALENWETIKMAELDIVQFIIERNTAPEMRLAHLQGYSNSLGQHRIEMEELSPEDLANYLKSSAGLAKGVSKGLIALNNFDKAREYFAIAHEFITGNLSKKFPQAVSNKQPAILAADEIEEVVTHLNSKAIFSEDTITFFRNAAKWLGLAQIGFAITTVVFETLAHQNQWANTIASASVAAGAGIALGAIITGDAVLSVITATLVAAGSSAEFPPIAAAVIAAGIAILAGMAISLLFDILIDFIFGITEIPASMRLSMTLPTYSQISSRMSLSMASSMVSLPV